MLLEACSPVYKNHPAADKMADKSKCDISLDSLENSLDNLHSIISATEHRLINISRPDDSPKIASNSNCSDGSKPGFRIVERIDHASYLITRAQERLDTLLASLDI